VPRNLRRHAEHEECRGPSLVQQLAVRKCGNLQVRAAALEASSGYRKEGPERQAPFGFQNRSWRRASYQSWRPRCRPPGQLGRFWPVDTADGPKTVWGVGVKKSQADMASAARVGDEDAFRSATCAEEVRSDQW